MNGKIVVPERHPDVWVNRLRPYMTDAVCTLTAAGLHVQHVWLDPSGPRDATIRFGDTSALVFDEVSGWRQGVFVSGQQGERTTLAEASYLGGGVLPDTSELAYRLINCISVARPAYRAVADVRDGFEDALRHRGGV